MWEWCAGRKTTSSMHLSELPAECVSRVWAFESRDVRQLKRFCAVCKKFGELQRESDVWLGLCCMHYGARVSRFWGQGLSLYEGLDAWGDRLGAYTVAGGFPWGALCVLRLIDGDVVGEVVRWLPKGGSWASDEPFSRTRSGFVEFTVRFLTVPLADATRIDASCGGGETWLLDGTVDVEAVDDATTLRRRLSHAFPLFDRMRDVGVFATDRALRLTASSAAACRADFQELVELDDLFWLPTPRTHEEERGRSLLSRHSRGRPGESFVLTLLFKLL